MPSDSRSEQFRAPKGTHDALPPQSARWERLVSVFAGLVSRAGYGLVQSPMFEDIGVFRRMGATTDVVTKEMYDFHDKGGRHVALRPEGTASVVRAYVEHRPPLPFKAWYAAPSFRYERPQAGRYRQHHQVGVEALGPSDPDLDTEVIVLAWDVLAELGLRDVTVAVNSLGDAESRDSYRAALIEHFSPHVDSLGETDRDRLRDNPLRLLDSKDPATAELVAAAPRVDDHLSDAAAAHFARVQRGLTASGVPFTVDPQLVRGLDYYTHTLFELKAAALDAAQDAVGGGGRYDGLAEALGGPPTPGIGFGLGIERLLLACDAEGVFGATDTAVAVFVIDTAGGEHARDLTVALRRAGVSADRAFDDRSMKAQFKAADRSGATLAVVMGPDEAAAGRVRVQDLRTDAPPMDVERAAAVDAVIERIRRPGDDR